jgi:hypothetical protein
MTSNMHEICARCNHFKMKDYPKHAAVGLGRCGGYDNGPTTLIKPFIPWANPGCARWTRAAGMEARMVWIEKQDKAIAAKYAGA